MHRVSAVTNPECRPCCDAAFVVRKVIFIHSSWKFTRMLHRLIVFCCLATRLSAIFSYFKANSLYINHLCTFSSIYKLTLRNVWWSLDWHSLGMRETVTSCFSEYGATVNPKWHRRHLPLLTQSRLSRYRHTLAKYGKYITPFFKYQLKSIQMTSKNRWHQFISV